MLRFCYDPHNDNANMLLFNITILAHHVSITYHLGHIQNQLCSGVGVEGVQGGVYLCIEHNRCEIIKK